MCGVEIYTYRHFLFTKVKLHVEVCSAGVRFCSCVEAWSPSFSLIRLRHGGLQQRWVAGPLSMFLVLVCSRSIPFCPWVGVSSYGW